MASILTTLVNNKPKNIGSDATACLFWRLCYLGTNENHTPVQNGDGNSSG
jgi:hypothetical protein